MISENTTDFTNNDASQLALQLATDGAIQLPPIFNPSLNDASFFASRVRTPGQLFNVLTGSTPFPIMDSLVRLATSKGISRAHAEVIIREDNSIGNKNWHQDDFNQIMSLVLPLGIEPDAAMAIGDRNSSEFEGDPLFRLPYGNGPILIAQRGFGSALSGFSGPQDYTWHKPSEAKPLGTILALDLFI